MTPLEIVKATRLLNKCYQRPITVKELQDAREELLDLVLPHLAGLLGLVSACSTTLGWADELVR